MCDSTEILERADMGGVFRGGNEYETSILLQTENDLKDVEFRTYVAEGVECILKEIQVVSVNVSK